MNMLIDKYEKIGKDKYRLYLSNGEVIDTYDNVILKNNLLINKNINEKIYDKIFSDTMVEEFYNKAYKYISLRLRSEKEIRDYLKRKDSSSEIINDVIERLKKEKLIDDERFAVAFIKDKLKFTTKGEYKIINELKQLGISSQIIEKCLYVMNEDILVERIIKVVEKQIKSNKKYDNRTLRNKIYNSLVGAGYTSSLVVRVLNNYF